MPEIDRFDLWALQAAYLEAAGTAENNQDMVNCGQSLNEAIAMKAKLEDEVKRLLDRFNDERILVTELMLRIDPRNADLRKELSAEIDQAVPIRKAAMESVYQAADKSVLTIIPQDTSDPAAVAAGKSILKAIRNHIEQQCP